MVEIDMHVTGHKQIETSIAIVVAPGCACAPTLARDTHFFSNVGERAVAVVAIKTRDAEVADEHVRTTIVVVVTDGDAESPALVRHSRFVGHIFKLPVTEIVIERGARRLFLAAHSADGGTVYDVNVGATVAVVVKDRHAA